MSSATFSTPDLDNFCRLDLLGLSVTGQRVGVDHAVLACRVLEPDGWCRKCGARGVPRDTVLRELAHVPLGWRPTNLHVQVRRYRCTGCGHVWRQNTEQAAAGRHVAPVNDAVLGAGRALLINDPARLDGVRVIGVDEHAWRHTRHGDKFVTVIIDLTPVRERTGPARLLDMVPGRSKQVFKTWLE